MKRGSSKWQCDVATVIQLVELNIIRRLIDGTVSSGARTGGYVGEMHQGERRPVKVKVQV